MIFILEDNDDRIAAFKEVLGDLPHHFERTVPQAISWLEQHKDQVILYSLDNDLIVMDFDGDEGEGWELCDWILANAPRMPIICHTTNSHAAWKMECACSEAKWRFERVAPYLAFEWIAESWIQTVKNVIC